MKSLNNIKDFGANSAEADDFLLARCFQYHPALQKVLEDRHFLVLGRKGSGKTAFCKEIIRLQDRQHDVFSVKYDFTRYPWDYHRLMAVPAEQEIYLHSWRYLILLALAKIVLNVDHSQRNSDAHKKIEQFVVDTYGSTDPDITKIFQPGKRLRGLTKLGIEIFGVKAEGEADELDLKNLPRMFQDVNSSLQRLIIESLNPANRYYVCFDGLDFDFQPDSLEYKQRLIGLILAARDFANVASESERSLKVLIFLRSDIYKNHLLFEDKNKITRTHGVEIEWDKPHQGVTLKAMMERRFAEVLEISRQNAWEQIFDESVGIGAHESKYSYVLDHTFRRPRDVIEFCNCTLNVHKYRCSIENDASRQTVFTKEDVYNARLEYGQYLHGEIVDEIFKQCEDYEIYFEMLRHIGYQLFSRSAFHEAYEVWKERLKFPEHSDQILEHLFEFSIIGFARDLTSGLSKAKYTFKHLDSTSQFNRSYEHFSVHWGLVKFLDLKRDQPTEGFDSKDPNIGGSMTVEVLDASGVIPSSIFSTENPGILRVAWRVHGPAVPALDVDWVVHAFLESMGPGLEKMIPEQVVPVKSGVYSAVPYPTFSYEQDMPLSAPPGIYKLVATITYRLPNGARGPIAMFKEAPLLEFYDH